MKSGGWCLAVVLLSASSALAAEASDVEALRKQVEALQEQVRSLQDGKPSSSDDGPISRFNGRWEGKILGDERINCREGTVRLTVDDGKVEGTRWFFSGNLAPLKGRVEPSGKYFGYQNRIDVNGQFSESQATMWYVSGSCQRKVELTKVGGL